MSWFSVFGRSSVFVISRICSLSHWTNHEGLVSQVAALPYSKSTDVGVKQSDGGGW